MKEYKKGQITFSFSGDLDEAYKAANLDFDRLKVIEEWNLLDDKSDGVSFDDVDWSWLRNSRI